MTMGYVIEIIHGPRERICPFCGDETPLPVGLAIVQRPSGDGVCEECAEAELGGLHIDVCVLREETSTVYPDRWAGLEARLAREPGPDEELSRLLSSVAMQRDPAYQHAKSTQDERT